MNNNTTLRDLTAAELRIVHGGDKNTPPTPQPDITLHHVRSSTKYDAAFDAYIRQ